MIESENIWKVVNGIGEIFLYKAQSKRRDIFNKVNRIGDQSLPCFQLCSFQLSVKSDNDSANIRHQKKWWFQIDHVYINRKLILLNNLPLISLHFFHLMLHVCFFCVSKDFVSPHTSFPLLFFFANLLILIWPLAWPFFLFRVDTWQLLHQNYSPTPDYELRALLFVIFRRYGGGFNFWFQVHRWVPLVSKWFLPLGHLPYVLIRHEKSEVRNCKQRWWKCRFEICAQGCGWHRCWIGTTGFEGADEDHRGQEHRASRNES